MLACTWSSFKKAGPRLPATSHKTLYGTAHATLHVTSHVTAHENAPEMRLPWIFERCKSR
jgi:hypothetical protein